MIAANGKKTLYVVGGKNGSLICFNDKHAK
jgi:hypothetical protein